VSNDRKTIDAIKRTLRQTNELTYGETLCEVYAEYGNPLVNQALRELNSEDS
jgi:hypothetical protein